MLRTRLRLVIALGVAALLAAPAVAEDDPNADIFTNPSSGIFLRSSAPGVTNVALEESGEAADRFREERQAAASRGASQPTAGTNRHGMSDGILIDISDRRLYYYEGGLLVRDFPVAIPRAGERIHYGQTRVINKRRWPSWTPTPNMRRKNPSLPRTVRGGPNNPMGARALYLGWQYIRIHGTNNPSSIGRAVSSGCFRMHNENVTWLYDRVATNTVVKVQR